VSGFDANWLDLREPADHRSRNDELARLLTRHVGGRPTIEVLDLGCGTGSNLRATAPLLGPEQNWTLVDYDARLLDAAVRRLAKWAGDWERKKDKLILKKSGRTITVRFRRADLVNDFESVFGTPADLITASALFDLTSGDFIAEVAAEVIRRRAAFYTVLSYNGVQRWTPKHPADAEMAAAFRAHQVTDKGFGPAAGPMAPQLLATAFDAAAYHLNEADSTWRLEEADDALIRALIPGFVSAVRETEKVPEATIEDWLRPARTGALVGHTDTLALPA
jgi:SAM-dependent methyltransferase